MNNTLQELVELTRRDGVYETDRYGEVEEWQLGPYLYQSHAALGEAFYIDDVCVWNNW